METKEMRASTTGPAELDPRWQAIVNRDASFDGKFYYSVATTGVYCHPSCAARLANPKNVAFYSSREEAEKAGFRPCKRCKPDQGTLQERRSAAVASACRMIEKASEPPSLADLAKATGLSPHFLHRTFKDITGVTPKAYVNAARTRRVQQELGKEDSSVTEALYEAGFNSSSRFYEQADGMLGMKPTEYKKGGPNIPIRFAIGQCALGSILVAQSEKGVCAILLGDDPDELAKDLQDRFPNATLISGDAEFESLVSQVIGLVENPSKGLDLPLDVRGTAFQQRVWEALQRIPSGSTVTYAEVAAELGEPKATRAVAGACAANNLAVVIPCHRVVRSDGSISGYRWGVERKRELLRRENHGNA